VKTIIYVVTKNTHIFRSLFKSNRLTVLALPKKRTIFDVKKCYRAAEILQLKKIQK
jgi:hypothetical protein